MKLNLIYISLIAIFILTNCKNKSEAEQLYGKWMGAYIMSDDTATKSISSINPEPFPLLFDITPNEIIIKDFQTENRTEKTYTYTFEDSMLVLSSESITDTLRITKISSDSIVIQSLKNNNEKAVLKKINVNKPSVPSLAKKMCIYDYPALDYHDTIEFINDSLVFPEYFWNYSAYYSWENYRKLVYLDFHNQFSLPLFLDRTNGDTIFFKDYYTTTNSVYLLPIKYSKKTDIGKIYGSWIASKELNNDVELPPPPPLPGKTSNDLINKLTVSKDSIFFTYRGTQYNRNWVSNLTLEYIYLPKKIDHFKNIWTIEKLTDSDLIISISDDFGGNHKMIFNHIYE